MIKFKNKTYFRFLIFMFSLSLFSNPKASENLESHTISNGKIAFTLLTSKGKIEREIYSVTEDFAKKENGSVTGISSNGNFLLDIFWTYWNAPGKVNNSDVQLHLDKNDFEIYNITVENETPEKAIVVNLNSPQFGFDVNIKYSLGSEAFFIRKQISVSDKVYKNHFLQEVHTVYTDFNGIKNIIKNGGYGQPVAFETKNGGGFIACEFPIATNKIKENFVNTIETIGKKITEKGITASENVIAILPHKNVKYWFMQYLGDVRVAKLRPYTLYNSWYDLRSVEYPGVPEKFQMNEKNVLRIVDEIKTYFIEKHGISIDAVVLDDGWDVYDSDWQLRKKQFPNGLKPISEKLKSMNSVLGLWFGPTGGYSFRMRRIKWMKKHGYEVTGSLDNDWQAMLCLGGENYKSLFEKRVTDFVKTAKIGYYKWDGIQFSCSEPNHGHPVGEYSRRAIMDNVAEICDTVRALNPDIFLNITSGTWLSPWWLKYANTIWMQGGDYGYSDVPSIGKRDQAITYRDIVLYNDFRKYNLWFPIANLMTHGIIKGELQKLGGEAEPIDKFTDNAVLYFARGVTMYELYISPDILTDAEWNALAGALKWGKENFDILKNTEMIGGNPSNGEAYGYAHFKNNEAIIAVRNPVVDKNEIEFSLDENFGFASSAKNLVMEEIYPRNIISGELYESGDKIKVDLDGFETRIYRFYPISQAKKLLISGVDYVPQKDGSYLLAPTGDKIKFLNKNENEKFTVGNKSIEFSELKRMLSKIEKPNISNAFGEGYTETMMRLKPKLNSITQNGEIALLFKPENPSDSASMPKIFFTVNGKKEKNKTVENKGKWSWNVVKIGNDAKSVYIRAEGENVNGKGEIYLITYEKPEGVKVSFSNKIKDTLPPRPLPDGIIKVTRKITKVNVKF